MLNMTMWAGVALTVLGLASVIATGAATAAIPAIFGVMLLGLGALQRNPARANVAGWAAFGVGLLGLLAPLGNIARVVGSSGFTMNAATFANLTMALICASYLGLWVFERRMSGQQGTLR
ncbi:MAG: hypothetical protein AB4911_07335 [Oscillochloridaceae bacterium umkhey_bin13]